MKSIVKTALTLSVLLVLPGCLDYFSAKKNAVLEEKSESATPAASSEKAGKCSHKGCTQDHSKDTKAADHDDVQTQGVDEEDDDADMDDMDDVETQGLDDDEDDMEDMD